VTVELLAAPALAILEGFGEVDPSLSVQPVRFLEGRHGDGLLVEEATTNLITNPSVEAGLTGWTVAASGSGHSIERVTDRSFSGVASVKLTRGTGNSQARAPGVSLVAGTTYTWSVRVLAPVGVTYSILLSNFAGSTLGSQTNIAGTGRWETRTGTAVAGAAGNHVLTVEITGPSSGAVLWVDAAQVEQKAYATSYVDGSLGQGYAWTGAAHASSSTRAATVLDFAAPINGQTPFTLAAFLRPTVSAAAAAAASASSALLSIGGDADNRAALRLLNGSTLQGQILSGGVLVANSVAAAYGAAGATIFAAMAWDGSNVTTHVSLALGSLVSAAPIASPGLAVPATGLRVGNLFNDGSRPANGVVHQALVYSAALSAAELAAIALGGPVDYADDPRIVFAAATHDLAGKLKAHTAAGTGRQRLLRTVGGQLELGPGATARAEIPSGSGVGVGQFVSPVPTSDRVYLVTDVFSPGGVVDELTLRQIA
jgi:hypothetical protein